MLNQRGGESLAILEMCQTGTPFRFLHYPYPPLSILAC